MSRRQRKLSKSGWAYDINELWRWVVRSVHGGGRFVVGAEKRKSAVKQSVVWVITRSGGGG